MADFVIDASVASAWCFKDEATYYTDTVLDDVSGSVTAVAPRLLVGGIDNAPMGLL